MNLCHETIYKKIQTVLIKILKNVIYIFFKHYKKIKIYYTKKKFNKDGNEKNNILRYRWNTCKT